MENHWSPLTDKPVDTSNLTFGERMSIFNDNIKSHKNIVFFGGAGVSTASGIPDFRSKDGLYNQHDIQFDKYELEYLLSRDCLYYNPKVFYEFYRQKLDCRNIQPNTAHFKLAEMENAGKLDCIVTQNIDGRTRKLAARIYSKSTVQRTEFTAQTVVKNTHQTICSQTQMQSLNAAAVVR